MGFDKLSFDLGGETVLERSVRAFDECPEVDELVIVTGASGENAQRAAARCKKPVRLVKGGSTRAERRPQRRGPLPTADWWRSTTRPGPS